MSGCIPLLSNLHSPVFLLNSCLDLFSAPYLRRDPLSRSYGVNLPSSLTVNLSSALVSSTRPPVSVCGTGRCLIKHSARVFLEVCSIMIINSSEDSLYCQSSQPAFPPQVSRYTPSTNYSVSSHMLRFSVTAGILKHRAAEY